MWWKDVDINEPIIRQTSCADFLPVYWWNSFPTKIPTVSWSCNCAGQTPWSGIYVHGDIKEENIIFNAWWQGYQLPHWLWLGQKGRGKVPWGFSLFWGCELGIHMQRNTVWCRRNMIGFPFMQCVMKRCALCLHLSQSQSVKAIVDELDRVHVPLDKIASEFCCLDF